MPVNRPVIRTAALSALAVAVLATSGCGWFRKENTLYTQSVESRPLEVPPDLDRPRTEGAMPLPDQSTSVSRSEVGAPATAGGAVAAATGAAGFAAAGERDAVFARVGEVLAATPGVTVASSAQLLGTYDVSYEDSNFMIRIARAEGGAYVSAVDPRGQPAQGEAAQKLLAALRAQLGG